MATSAVAVLLLTIYVIFNHVAQGRLQKIKFLKFLYDPQKGIMNRINVVILFAAGFGLSAWLSGVAGWFNFDLFGLGIQLFSVLLLAGAFLFILDIFDGGGIKKSSYGIAFALPIVAAAHTGAIATAVIAASGGINQFAGSLLSALV